MTIASTWGLRRSGDIRTLKSQLDLAANTVRTTRLSAPLWALVAALLCSELFDVFGRIGLTRALLLPAIVGLVIATVSVAGTIYERQAAGSRRRG